MSYKGPVSIHFSPLKSTFNSKFNFTSLQNQTYNMHVFVIDLTNVDHKVVFLKMIKCFLAEFCSLPKFYHNYCSLLKVEERVCFPQLK